MDGGAWWAAKSRTRLSDFTFTFTFCPYCMALGISPLFSFLMCKMEVYFIKYKAVVYSVFNIYKLWLCFKMDGVL